MLQFETIVRPRNAAPDDMRRLNASAKLLPDFAIESTALGFQWLICIYSLSQWSHNDSARAAVLLDVYKTRMDEPCHSGYRGTSIFYAVIQASWP